MRHIGASILVLAAAILLVGGAAMPDTDTSLILMLAGVGVGIIGLVEWFRPS